MWYVYVFVMGLAIGLIAGTIWGRKAWDAAGDWIHATLWGK